MRVAARGQVGVSAQLDAGAGASPVAVAIAVAVAVAGAVLVTVVPAHLWPLVVSLLIAPVLEETVFRPGLHDGLLHRGAAPWRANLLTALAFSAAHMVLLGPGWHAALVGLPAWLIGAAYNRWRRVRICIALHMAMNAAWIAMHALA